ncbi:MAG: hypothetical protein ACRDGF_02120 [Chloroflexota bacterium]
MAESATVRTGGRTFARAHASPWMSMCLAVASAVLLVLTACASAPFSTGHVSSSPSGAAGSSPAASGTGSSSTSGAPAGSVVLESSDNGKVITIPVGTIVALGYERTGLIWDSQFDGSLLAASAPRELRAIAPGQTQLTSSGRPLCKPGTACPQFIVSFKATIVIRRATSSSGANAAQGRPRPMLDSTPTGA